MVRYVSDRKLRSGTGRVVSFATNNRSALDKSYYMGVYSLCFHRQNIRNFVNVSSVIFGC